MKVEEQLYKILNEYTEEMGEEVHSAFKDIGKETSLDLKNVSKQKFKKTKHSKHYANGWTYKARGKGLNTSVTIYNRTKPSLTHLLENGHMILTNGVNHGRTRAIKHIEPAEKEALNKLMTRLQK